MELNNNDKTVDRTYDINEDNNALIVGLTTS